MVHQIQLAFVLFTLGGVAYRITRDLRTGWPQVVQIARNRNSIMVEVRYTLTPCPCAAMTDIALPETEPARLAA